MCRSQVLIISSICLSLAACVTAKPVVQETFHRAPGSELTYRWSSQDRRCFDPEGHEGQNYEYVGECGLISSDQFDHRNWEGLDLRGATVRAGSIRSAKIQILKSDGLRFESTDWVDSELHDSDLRGAYGMDFQLFRSKLSRNDFRGTSIEVDAFNHSEISDSNFGGSYISGAIDHSTIERCQFFLAHVGLKQPHLSGTSDPEAWLLLGAQASILDSDFSDSVLRTKINPRAEFSSETDHPVFFRNRLAGTDLSQSRDFKLQVDLFNGEHDIGGTAWIKIDFSGSTTNSITRMPASVTPEQKQELGLPHPSED